MKQIQDYDLPDELMIEGWYFKPNSNNQMYYFLRVTPTQHDGNIIISISELETPQVELKSGEKIKVGDWQIEEIITMDIWGKYYFPKFIEQQPQWYHTEPKSNFIDGQSEVMNYALELGLKEGGITPY